jgi:hypothetical protein
MILYTHVVDMKKAPDELLRLALTRYIDSTMKELVTLEQIVHYKLLIRFIHKVFKRSAKQGAEYIPILEKLVTKLSRFQVKLEEHPALKDPRKRQGISSNYAQILTSLAYIKKFDDFEPIKKIIATMKILTDNYSSFLNPRDMSELVAAVCQLSILAKPDSLKTPRSSKKPKTTTP